MAIAFAVNTLSTAAIYLLLALAVVFAYRVSRVLLFCVGEIGMASAYLFSSVWKAALYTAPGFLMAAGAVLLLDVVLGVLLYAVLAQEKHGDAFVGTVITIAFAIILTGIAAVLWGGAIEQLPFPRDAVALGGNSVSSLSLAIVLLGSGLVAATLAIFYWTPLGIELQALANNRRLAVLVGISLRSRMLTVWICAAVMSGVAGIMSAAISSVSAEGAVIGFSGVVAAIIGGLTSPAGAIVGALLLATGETLIGVYSDARYGVVVPVGLLVVLLVFRPSGISARVEQIART